MKKEVMLRLGEPKVFVNRVSEPALWHTDLHMGSIYVSEDDPSSIVSLVDWQSIVVSPLVIQARFSTFLPVEDDYAFGTMEMPKLPPNYDELDTDDKAYADFKFREAKLAKVYEFSSMVEYNQGYRALLIPSFIQELFIRCADVSENVVIPLRACLVEMAYYWGELGFEGECPISFSEADLQKHEQQLDKYRAHHTVHELARNLIGTDLEGWISPYVDFAMKQKQNEELLMKVMRRSDEYGIEEEEVCMIWPYREI